jgi:hypothetical protein
MWSRACVCGDLECTLYIYFPCIREIWRFVHPRKVIFPEGNARGKYDYFEGEQIFLFHSNIYSTDIEIWLVETIPRHIYQNIVFPSQQRPREIWLFRGWTHFHFSLMQGKWMFYSTRPTFWWILSNEIFWPSLFTKLLFRNISGVISLYDQSVIT